MRPALKTRPVRRAVVAVGVVAAVGLAVGMLTMVGQGTLPGALNQLANIGAPWLFAAFLVGTRMATDRAAIAAGVGVLLFALAGYYLSAQVVQGSGGATTASSVAFWVAVAAVGGPTFGIAGRWSASGSSRQRVAGIGLLAGALISEGLHQVAVAWTPAVGIGEILVGAALPLLLVRSRAERLASSGWTVAATALGLAAFASFGWLSSILSGGG